MGMASRSVFARFLGKFYRFSKARFILHRLEQCGWLTASWSDSETGRPAKFYKLSAKGRKQLTTEERTWQRLTGAIILILQTTE